MLHVYAIADAAPDFLGVGVYGTKVHGVAVAPGLFAAFSSHEQAPRSDVEELWRHEEVVEGLMQDGATVLPLRFGASVADEAELTAAIGARAEEFGELLREVRGAVELSVRVELPASAATRTEHPDADPPASGGEYMQMRGAEMRAREEVEARYHAPLDRIARRSQLSHHRLGSAGFKAAYLVETDRVEEFTDLVRSLEREGPARISCTGPWPPYSFVAMVRR